MQNNGRMPDKRDKVLLVSLLFRIETLSKCYDLSMVSARMERKSERTLSGPAWNVGLLNNTK
jgi:hypothetical protein